MDKETEERFLNPEVQEHLRMIRKSFPKELYKKIKRKSDAKKRSP